MTYPGWLPTALGALLYVWQSYEYFKIGDWPMSGVFIGYVIANLFFIAAFIVVHGNV